MNQSLNFEQDQLKNVQKSRDLLQRSSLLLQKSHNQGNNMISQKIQAMKHSINQLSILSSGKPLQNLNRIQSELILHKDQVQNNQKKSLNQLTSLQKTLLSLQKQRFLKQVFIKNQKQSINQQFTSFQQDIDKSHNKITTKISQFRDKMTDIKIQIVQNDAKYRQKAQKTKQKYIKQLMNSDKQLSMLNKNDKSLLKDKTKNNFKQLNINIEQQYRKMIKEKKKYRSIIDQLKIQINSKMQHQQNKQKEGFQHNYDALEEIFLLLASQIHQK